MRFSIYLLWISLMTSACIPQTLATPTPSPVLTLQPGIAQTEPIPTKSRESGLTPEPLSTLTPEPAGMPGWIAFTTLDGNISLVHPFDKVHQQLTTDAVPLRLGSESLTISYCCSKWSSDGKMLAFQREVGIRQGDGYKYEFSLLVYEAASGIVRQIIENQRLIGFSWEPGTYRIAYGIETSGDYFASRSGPSPEFAKGIWAVDITTGDAVELVSPQQGYWLVNPQWSPSGRYLVFEEVLYMEGKGQFSFFDFSQQEYVSWGRSVGFFDWSPDEQRIAYDTLTYHPDGTERIWISSIIGSDERPFSPENSPGYSFYPVFSPMGDYLAYFSEVNGPESGQYILFTQPVAGGDPRELGVFSQVTNLYWSPDGKYLALSAGPYETREVFWVNFSDGSIEAIASGYQPALQPK